MRPITLAAVALVSIAAPAVAQTAPAAPSIDRLDPALDALIAPGTVPEKVATGFSFTEGPLWHKGKLWFSDVTGNKLRTVTADGTVTEVIANSGGLPNPPAGKNIGSNGLVPDKDGNILMAQMGMRQIVKVDAAGKTRPFVSAYQGKRMNSPNDMVYAADGSLWITDPPFGLYNGMDQDPAKELPYNPVWRYAGGKLTPVITDLKLPNGIAFSPDGKTLYVGDYGANTIYAYAYGADGKLSNRREVIKFERTGPGGADGMKVDRNGNIWSTSPGGIRIVTPQGKVLGQIKLPEVAANLAWGPDAKTLYITGSTSIYRIKTSVAGVLPRFFRP